MSALRDALSSLSDDVFFDLLESDEAYLLVLDVPGAAADTLDVSVDGDRIEIEARREKPSEDGYRYLEENRPLFHDLDLPLPEDAVGRDAEAVVDRGVLELTLPKRESAAGTRIDVVDREGEGESGVDRNAGREGGVDRDAGREGGVDRGVDASLEGGTGEERDG